MSDSLTIKGKVKVLMPTQSFNSGFKKRELVITTPGEYPQDLKVEVTKDNCDKINHIQPGQEVTAHINLRGNEYNGRYFVNLICWKLEEHSTQQGYNPNQDPAYQQQAPGTPDPHDDIPF